MKTCKLSSSEKVSMPLVSPDLFTTSEAAQYLGLNEHMLKRDRWDGELKVPFIRIGRRQARYRRQDLDQWIASRESQTPSAPEPKR